MRKSGNKIIHYRVKNICGVLYKYTRKVCSYKLVCMSRAIYNTAQIHSFFVLCNMACWVVCILYIIQQWCQWFLWKYITILRTTHNVKVNINRWKLQWKIESDKLQNAICQWMSTYVLTFNSEPVSCVFWQTIAFLYVVFLF